VNYDIFDDSAGRWRIICPRLDVASIDNRSPEDGTTRYWRVY